MRPDDTIRSTGEGGTIYSSSGDISNGDKIEKKRLNSAVPVPVLEHLPLLMSMMLTVILFHYPTKADD